MDMDEWRIVAACVGGESPQHLFCAAEHVVTVESGHANSTFFVLHEGEWFAYATQVDWTAVAMAAVRNPASGMWDVIALSASGDVWVLQPLAQTEAVSRIADIQGLTALRTVGGHVYACGMGRIVLRRESSGEWTNISAPWPSPEEGVIGFTSLASAGQGGLYAAGWQGEIWKYIQDRWLREEAPTNGNLNALIVLEEGSALAVGDNGVVLKGKSGAWSVVDVGTDFNLLDACECSADILVCTDYQLFKLTDAGLAPVFADEVVDRSNTFFKLLVSTDGCVYTVGSYDVFERQSDAWAKLV